MLTASHRRCPPKVLEQPQDVVAGGGWLLFRMYYGPEFVSRAVLRWLHGANIDTAPIDPGKPWQKGLKESFNGKFRDECLSLHWFINRIDAKILIEGTDGSTTRFDPTRVSGS